MFKFISCCGSWLINNHNLWLHTSFVGCLPREAKTRYEHLQLFNSACVWLCGVGVWCGCVVWVWGGVVCACVCGWYGWVMCVGGVGVWESCVCACVWVGCVCMHVGVWCGCLCVRMGGMGAWGGGVVRVGRVCMRIYVCMHDWMRGVERRRERLKFLVMTFFIFHPRLSNPCSRQDKGGSANGWTGMKLCQFWVEIKH